MKTSNNSKPYTEWTKDELVAEIRKRTSGARPTKYQAEQTDVSKFVAFLEAWDGLGPAKKTGNGGGGTETPVRRLGDKAVEFIDQQIKGDYRLRRPKDGSGFVVVNGKETYALMVNSASGAYSLRSI